MKCPHCNRDIADGLVLSQAARIMAKRRVHKITPDEAREMQLKSAVARKRNREAGASGDLEGV